MEEEIGIMRIPRIIRINMIQTTLCFLTKEAEGSITQICLAMKKRGFGINKWNGVGGKIHKRETIDQAMIRETKEEIGVDVTKYTKVAELIFDYQHNPESSTCAHVYFSFAWIGTPKESDEMTPQWFNVINLPYASMWPDDQYWLPLVLENKKIQAYFKFSDFNTIIENKINFV